MIPELGHFALILALLLSLVLATLPVVGAHKRVPAWMALAPVETKVGTAVIDRRALLYPISLEQVGEGGKLTWIGSCDTNTCTAQK